MSQELVTIIVPSYKRHSDLVERAINSLLNQTYKNIEVIVVDDNAKPGLESYREEISNLIASIDDKRVVYVQNAENKGGAGSRNVAIAIAKGEYITFLDDDDEYLPLKVETQLEFMKANGLDMSFGKLNLYNEKDELVDVREHDIKTFDKTFLRKYHLTKQITGTPTFMLKRELLQQVGGFEIVPMGQEYYLMQKILQTDCTMGYFPDCHIKAYRTAAEAISTGKGKITGEKALFKYKKSFFNILSFREKQYVRCRHYAVMAVAYKRNKMYFKALCNLFVSVLCSPLTAVKEALGLQKRKKETANEKTC